MARIANRVRTRPVMTPMYQSLIVSSPYGNPRKTSQAFTDPTIGPFKEKLKPQMVQLIQQIEESKITPQEPDHVQHFEAWGHGCFFLYR